MAISFKGRQMHEIRIGQKIVQEHLFGLKLAAWIQDPQQNCAKVKAVDTEEICLYQEATEDNLKRWRMI